MESFDFSPYDLKDREQRQEATRAWMAWLKEYGYRTDAEAEHDEHGMLTMAALAERIDAFSHNLSITLRETIDELGGRETQAGKVVSNLWHDIISNELNTHRHLMHYTLLQESAKQD